MNKQIEHRPDLQSNNSVFVLAALPRISTELN
jgi:hypothetical protein